MPDQNRNEEDTVVDARLTRLVSYLDGELPPEERATVEQELQTDETLRTYADELDRTWDMLEVLQPVSASHQFTRQTLDSIEAIKVEEASQAGQTTAIDRVPLYRMMTRFLLSAVITAAVVLLAGVLASRIRSDSADNPDLQMLRDLRFYENYRKYRSIPDAAFLESLPDSFPENSAAVSDQTEVQR